MNSFQFWNLKEKWIFSYICLIILQKQIFENTTGIDTSSFAKKVDLASLNSNVNKLHVGKLKNLPTNLSNFKSKVDKLDADK